MLTPENTDVISGSLETRTEGCRTPDREECGSSFLMIITKTGMAMADDEDQIIVELIEDSVY